mgnify:CR=1 FL=1
MIRGFSISNFEQASNLISNGAYKIDDSCYMKRDDTSISIFLDGFEIVTYHSNGVVEIKNHGYYNLRFKRYLSQLSPVKIVQKEYQWYLGEQVFFSSMKFENGEWRKNG